MCTRNHHSSEEICGAYQHAVPKHKLRVPEHTHKVLEPHLSHSHHHPPPPQVPVTRFLSGRSLVNESEMPRPFLETSLQEKGNKPDGQPEYIILEEEGPSELVEDEDDDGYVQDLVRGPCVYVRELGVYVSEQRAGRLSKYLPKNGDYERTYFTREVISHT